MARATPGTPLMARKRASQQQPQPRPPPPPPRQPRVKSRRIALVVVVLLADLFFSGVIFGWAPLLLMLLDEEQYGELCRGSELELPLDEPCVEQENRLNLMFALAAVATNAVSLPVGMFLDRVGPKITTALAGLVQVVALLLMAVADSKTFDVFLPAYVLMAVGGAMTMMVSYPASFLIMQHQTAILAAISCLFDGSSVVFLLLYSIRSVFRASRFVLFTGYAGFAVVVYVLMIALWHANERELFERQASQLDDNDDDTSSAKEDLSHNSPVSERAAKVLLQSHYLDYGALNEAQLASDHEVDEIRELYRTGMIDSHLSEIAVQQQLQTYEFVYIVAFAGVHLLRTSVFIGTANKLLLNYGDSMKHFLYTKIFSLVLPLGFVFVPMIDCLVERPRGLALSLIVTNVLGVLYNTLVLIPVLPVQSATFVLFTGFRAFLYAVLSAFTAKTFGLKTMGTLMGIMFSIGSIVSLLEYPAVYVSNLRADGDLTTVFWLSLVACLALFPLTELYRRREAERDCKHTQLLASFGATLDSPDPLQDQGLSFRRSPPTTLEASALGATKKKAIRVQSLQPQHQTWSEA